MTGVDVHQVSNMPPPWGKCGETDLDYFGVYSVPTCVTECETDYVYKQCACIDISMPSDDGRCPPYSSKLVSNKCIAVRKVATPLRELTCHIMGSHSVTCHPAEVTRPYPSRSWYSIKRPRRDVRLS